MTRSAPTARHCTKNASKMLRVSRLALGTCQFPPLEVLSVIASRVPLGLDRGALAEKGARWDSIGASKAQAGDFRSLPSGAWERLQQAFSPRSGLRFELYVSCRRPTPAASQAVERPEPQAGASS